MAVIFLLCYSAAVCVHSSIWILLWICICGWMQVLWFLCLSHSVGVCMCAWGLSLVFLFASVSIFSFVCLCLVSVCLMCRILSMLLSVPIWCSHWVWVFMPLLCVCIPVSLLPYVSGLLEGVHRYWRVCNSLMALWVSPWCDVFQQVRGMWLTLSVSSMLLGGEWPKKEPWSCRWT